MAPGSGAKSALSMVRASEASGSTKGIVALKGYSTVRVNVRLLRGLKRGVWVLGFRGLRAKETFRV